MPSQPSRQAPGEPGRQKMKVAPATPAVARLWIVEAPILAWLSMWKAIEKPSIRFSNSGSIASGVTSRPVKPVPPVVMMASTPASAIHRLTMTRIASTSSMMISRAASVWPAAVEPLGQRGAGLVVRQRAGVRDRQHRDVERHEGSCFVDGGHWPLYPSCPGRGAAPQSQHP